VGAAAGKGKAMFFGGLYDTQVPGVDVRIIVKPTNPYDLRLCISLRWRRFNCQSVDNLEDAVGGHIWVALLLIMAVFSTLSPSPFALGAPWFHLNGRSLPVL